MCFWVSKNQKNCQKCLILTIFFSSGEGASEGGRASDCPPPWCRHCQGVFSIVHATCCTSRLWFTQIELPLLSPTTCMCRPYPGFLWCDLWIWCIRMRWDPCGFIPCITGWLIILRFYTCIIEFNGNCYRLILWRNSKTSNFVKIITMKGHDDLILVSCMLVAFKCTKVIFWKIKKNK